MKAEHPGFDGRRVGEVELGLVPGRQSLGEGLTARINSRGASIEVGVDCRRGRRKISASVGERT